MKRNLLLCAFILISQMCSMCPMEHAGAGAAGSVTSQTPPSVTTAKCSAVTSHVRSSSDLYARRRSDSLSSQQESYAMDQNGLWEALKINNAKKMDARDILRILMINRGIVARENKNMKLKLIEIFACWPELWPELADKWSEMELEEKIKHIDLKKAIKVFNNYIKFCESRRKAISAAFTEASVSFARSTPVSLPSSTSAGSTVIAAGAGSAGIPQVVRGNLTGTTDVSQEPTVPVIPVRAFETAAGESVPELRSSRDPHAASAAGIRASAPVATVAASHSGCGCCCVML